MSKLLDGVRILDLTNVLSGPFCTYQLVQQGAEVVKIEVPGSGDLARQFGMDSELSRKRMGTGFLAQNSGKRSMTLNLKSARGKEIFFRLAERSDVVIENFRPGVMDRLGCGYQALRAAKPSIIYCAISGFGQDGPWRDKPAYDQIVQGLSGIMSVTGDAGSAPLRVGFPVCDTVGGLTAAFAVCAALFRRAVTGEGQLIDVSLLEASLVTMGWAVGNYLMTGKTPAPAGNVNITASPSGAFRTADGLLNISANTDAQFHALCRALDKRHLSEDPRFCDRAARMANRTALDAEIEEALASHGAAWWEETLNAADVPAGRILDVAEILNAPHIRERGFLVDVPKVDGLDRELVVLRSGFRLSGGDPKVDAPPPKLGQDTAEILTELGFTDADLVGLREENVI